MSWTMSVQIFVLSMTVAACSLDLDRIDRPCRADGDCDATQALCDRQRGVCARVRYYQPGAKVDSYAGTGSAGGADTTRLQATFNKPSGLFRESDGALLVADRSNHRIRKVTATDVTTITGAESGFADGTLKDARFSLPSGVVRDGNNRLLVTEAGNHRVRAVDIAGDSVATLAGGSAGFADGALTSARFKQPSGVAVASGGRVIIADSANHRIRVMASNTVKTLAGTGERGLVDGPAASAKFDSPVAVAVDSAGQIYVVDRGNHRIRRISTTGEVSTYAGTGEEGFADGPVDQALFQFPEGLAIDESTGAVVLYIADTLNSRVRIIDSKGVSTVAGGGAAATQDGLAPEARFEQPIALAVESGTIIYVADRAANRIRRITLQQ